MDGILFAHPLTLFGRVGKVLKEVGPKKFFTSPDERVKQAREGFAAYFFTLALKKYTNRDWWLAQYDQAKKAYPDFDFISFAENPDDLKLEPVELTGGYPNFKTFDEVVKVVEKKKKQYGTKPVNFSLLIFFNHKKSEEWINFLRKEIDNQHPFISIWTVHLLFKEGEKEVKQVVAQKIVPLPGLRIEADTDDSELYKPQRLPAYTQQHQDGERTFVTFKTDFINKFKKYYENQSAKNSNS